MSRVVVETRKAYVVQLGDRRRRFWSAGAAYYAIAKRLLGTKYMAAMKAVDDDGAAVDGLAADLGVPFEIVQARAARARALFVIVHRDEGDEFSSKLWQAYVRRVAGKLRKLDEHAARKAARS